MVEDDGYVLHHGSPRKFVSHNDKRIVLTECIDNALRFKSLDELESFVRQRVGSGTSMTRDNGIIQLLDSTSMTVIWSSCSYRQALIELVTES